MTKATLFYYCCMLLTATIIVSCSSPKPPKAHTAPTRLHITELGAKPNDGQPDTEAIQQALDSLSAMGGGVVVIPKGTFFSGTIFLKNNTTLHLEQGAQLLADTVDSAFPKTEVSYNSQNRSYGGHINLKPNQRQAFIFANGVQNVGITGSGTIDGHGGQGADFRVTVDSTGKWHKPRRPFLVLFTSCKNIKIQGPTLQHTQTWHLHLENCDSALINNITIKGHANANDDGIDINGSRYVKIKNCHVDVGDDGLVFKTKGAAPLHHIEVRHCTFASETRCIQFGSETEADMHHIEIKNCTLTATAPRPEWPEPGAFPVSKLIKQSQGAAISINSNDGATLQHITIDSIYITGLQSPFYLHSARRKWSYSEGQFDTTMPTGTLKNITLRNIKAVNIPNTANPTIMGTPESPLENITLENISIAYQGAFADSLLLTELPNMFDHCAWPGYWGKRKHYPALGFVARYVNNLKVSNFTISTTTPDPRPYFVTQHCKQVALPPQP